MLTPFFFGTCQSGGQAGDGEWAGARLRRKKEHIGPLARGSITTDGAMEGAGEAGSASYVLGFVLFN